ncbi:MAG TPA: 16S rRNA (cytosine(967)-C(5))-methyltransferase RsmB [Woeseiaceae bacterium]|nr:16S rRNA (cytosine(967)-C(5))-methyltransferase RsmB [Woeseiaceae bacterium]
MTPPGASVRAAAARAVDAVVTGGRSLDTALAAAEAGLPAADHPLLRHLAFGTLRRYFSLGATIDALATRPPRGRDSLLRALLAVGLLQLRETRIPDHAAVSPTVDAARLLGRAKAAGFVNALLRRYLREGDRLPPPAGGEAAWNHPAWLIDRLRADWPDDWQAILTANDARAPMWLRVNRRRTTADAYRGRLAAAGIAAESRPGWPDALVLADPVPVAALPGFPEGDVSVQDGAAQLAAPWLLADGAFDAGGGTAPGTRVLDACAAPGGKTAHLKEIGGAAVDVVAVEKDPERARRIEETLARLGLAATVRIGDASTPGTWHRPPAYRAILLDAPCSATGVIRRHPDIRHLRRAGDIPALAGLQRSILDALWQLLAPGGRLLYVTCSVLASENDALVAAFLGATPDARENTMLQNNNIRDVMRRKACGYQVLPGTAGMDGFYFACLDKVR